jgi:hypothetical protein
VLWPKVGLGGPTCQAGRPARVAGGPSNLGKTSSMDISDTHLLSYSAAILDDLPDKMGDPGVLSISCLIGTQKFD